jgi:periplasmic protein TonB
MNDEQLVQLFAAQKIPPATDAAKAAALSAAMQAFAALPDASMDPHLALADNKIQPAPTAANTHAEPSAPAPAPAPVWSILIGRLRRLGRTGAAEPKHPGRYSLNPPAARYSGLLAVAGLHIGVVLALVVGLSPLNEMGSSEQVNIVVLEEALHKEVAATAAPAAPLADFAPAPPAEEVEFSVAAEKAAPASSSVARAAAKTDAKSVAIAEVKAAAKAPPAATQAKSAQPKSALTAPAYPKESKKLGEQGAVALALFIDEQGGVREARVESSSGFKRLNDAAVNHARTAWAFAPCTEGNQPIGCWLKIKIIFNLKEE